MKLLNLSLLLFLLSSPAFAENISGSWEGYFFGSHVHQGSMQLNINKSSCTVHMKRLDKIEVLEFPCSNITEENGVYTILATKGFSAGPGVTEWKFIFSLGIGANNPNANVKIIGAWIQGMSENTSSKFIALNSGFMRLKKV